MIDTDELDRMKRQLAAYEDKDAKREREREQRLKNIKTPEQLAKMWKPFPMPGQVWRFDGTDTSPASDKPDIIISLRWFYGRAEAVFYPGDSVAGIEHMMELDAWKFVH